MDAAVTEPPNISSSKLTSEISAEDRSAHVRPSVDARETAFRLGLWLSGLESFVNIQNHAFAEESYSNAMSRDWSREFRLTHSTLLLCSRLARQLADELTGPVDQENARPAEIMPAEVYKLFLALRDTVLINEGMLRGVPIKFAEWVAWGNLLSDKVKSLAISNQLVRVAEQIGENALPGGLAELLDKKTMPLADQTDLRLVLPRFAKILKWLSVVGEMLDRDKPLKPSLLIFARVHEQINEMMAYINNRLLRFQNEEAELFGVLDGASYAASIELRKVYYHELSGIVDIRTTPSVYARVETAFALLHDSFQLTMLSFAQLIDPEVESDKIFPNLRVKRDQSVVLRQQMWEMLKDVRNAEKDPDKFPLGDLHKKLIHFRDKTQHFLFYKDKETVERFIEEVLITRNKKDLVPILHRFSAYIETLFGQVNMRIVLANHPFEAP